MGETNMWEKIETFLFDIMGLLLPGIVFLVGISLTSMLLVSDDFINKSGQAIEHIVLFETIADNSKGLTKNMWILVVFFFFTAYLTGHAIKVFSKIYYSFCELIFDKLINKIFIHISKLFIKILSSLRQINLINKIIFPFRSYTFISEIFKYVMSLITFFKKLISEIFIYRTQYYENSNKNFVTESMEIINKKFKTNFPKEWYSFYKLSKIIIYHENLKNMNDTFLAKYNLYRSLSFITFLQILAIIAFHFNEDILNKHAYIIEIILLVINFIFWYTFHEKYKRYFRLCGNETLVAVYYHLKKNENNI